MDKPILSDNMKVVTCPKCGKILQKSITTVSEFVCPCKYKFDAVVQGDFVMYYNVRRHIVGGTYRTLISVQNPLRLCRTGICRSLSAG